MRYWLLLVVGLLYGVVLAQDRVVLKDGQVFEGKVEKETKKTVFLRTKYGLLRIPRDKIARLQKEKTPEDEYAAKRKRIAQQLFELALWCKKHGLQKQALRHLKEVLKFDPNHEGARKLLGYVRKDKRWVKVKPTKKEPKSSGESKQPVSPQMSREEWRKLHVEAAKHLFAEEFEKALELYRKILKAYPKDYLALYQSACALARLGRSKEALEKLRKAVECGFKDAEKLRTEPDLQSLHNTEEFKKILRLITTSTKKTSPQKDEKKNGGKKKPRTKFF